MKIAPQNWTTFMSNKANLHSWSSNKKRSVVCKDDFFMVLVSVLVYIAPVFVFLLSGESACESKANIPLKHKCHQITMKQYVKHETLPGRNT